MTGAQPNKISQEEALQNLVLDGDLERLGDLIAEFNLFDVLKIERREAQHSALLAWLLDPRGSHGLRDYFLRRFLSQVAAEAYERGITDITPLDVGRWNLDNIEVATERHNIDILLISEADEFVCLIENKIGAGEHSNQLARYLAIAEREYQGLIPFPIFLTPDGIEPESEDDAERYVPFDYRRVAGLIDRTLRTQGSILSNSVAGFLEQYAQTLRRHILTSSDYTNEMALQIYNKHQAAIDLIIEAKSSAESALETKWWSIIHQAIEKLAPRLKPDFDSKKIHRFFSLDLDEISQLKEATRWTDSGRLLLFEVKYPERKLYFYIGPGPAETRKRLYNLVQGAALRRIVGVNHSWKLGKRWYAMYSQPLLTKHGPSEPDYEKGRPQVEQAIATFFRNDYYPIVNAIRKEFGLHPVSPDAY